MHARWDGGQRCGVITEAAHDPPTRFAEAQLIPVVVGEEVRAGPRRAAQRSLVPAHTQIVGRGPRRGPERGTVGVALALDPARSGECGRGMRRVPSRRTEPAY